MTAKRKLNASTAWTIAVVAIGLGTLGTLLMTNAVNHAGWNPWVVVVGWAFIVALAAMVIKLRGSTGLASRPMGPMGGRDGVHPGDGMNAGDGG
jgi:hypothetical protein